ncbi:ATP-dependent helicase [Sulfitobacter sp. JBTF-M27]|uniref:ATP-dependent helicase n=1 Tax=Sulfitobacter sediminilitoris TaxID=2698830 RepID=A0A6P0CDC7_9RHOB|nr:DISARM system SNF2-like helicase DrmD [Sulfitobacter sediminilitoris]NEK24209.1 ATP-dependent helicase [Sulfitobacter sediminilitoris]
MGSPKFEIGQCVRVRRRHWLIENIESSEFAPDVLEIRCLDDDATGQKQLILPRSEIAIECVDDELWHQLGSNVPTDAKGYSAYLQSLQWNTATAADNKLFQAPFRAGIEISPYQLTPLAKALDLPRVNLLIADDVGLGKTIEAGLVLRELLLRKRVDFFVVSSPASMTQQWKEELSSKFGLTAEIVDADFFAEMRAERGFGYNPWQSGNAFIISHSLLRDEGYMVGLKAILGAPRARSMFILDEAHHAAPAHSQAYATDSQMTRAVRELSKMFEHRLFLTATPHNGHSNSFAALLEMLDPQRFTRGIAVSQDEHDAIMVRRLKSDLRELTDTPFPVRHVDNIELPDTPAEAPELDLFQSLLDFGELEGSKGGHSFVLLQQRLLSSVSAFCTTLQGEVNKMVNGDVKMAAEALLKTATRQAFKGDSKSKNLAAWIREHLGQGSSWNQRRLIVFSEYQTTIDWLKKQLLEELSVELEDERIAEFTGDTDKNERERLKARFNADPAMEPLRILLCTDAAREGINLQHRCYDLFHFDLPWNPSRLEQRNGRIDRRLQPNPDVYCRYFTYKHRPSDRILAALVRKTERINRELGEVGSVIETEIEKRFKTGITRENMDRLEQDLESESYLEAQRLKEELLIAPEKHKRLRKLESELQSIARRLEQSKLQKNVAPNALQAVFLNALEKMHVDIGPKQINQENGVDVIALDPESPGFSNADWTPVFDQLRERPRNKDETVAEYRQNAPVKRVSFSPVKDGDRLQTGIEHLHLEHRLVRRLLAQFDAQGFRSRLERTAVLQTAIERPRVVLLIRLTLYAKGANRLHSEIIPVAASVNQKGVTPLKFEGQTASEVYRNLQEAIQSSSRPDEPICDEYRKRASADAQFLRDIAEQQARENEQNVRRELTEIGEAQARSLKLLLEQQRDRIIEQQGAVQQEFDFSEQEREQRRLDKLNWENRLQELDIEIESEPELVRQKHIVSARRIEPVGIVYLLPEKLS